MENISNISKVPLFKFLNFVRAVLKYSLNSKVLFAAHLDLTNIAVYDFLVTSI